MTGSQRGHVVAFDDAAGHGRILTEDGTELFFHCTAIADGTRAVEVGTPVRFRTVPGHNGRWEATAVVTPPGTVTPRTGAG